MIVADLHVDVHDGDGPPALLVHGVLSSRAQWLPNLAALRTVCRPVVVELLGHGRSAAPAEAGRYRPDGYVEAFEAVRRAVGADRWFVVGHSLGAALTMRYTLDHPERTIAQVFTNSASALADETWRREVADTLPTLARRVEEGGQAVIGRLPLHPSGIRHVTEEVHRTLVDDAALIDPGGLARTFLHTVPGASVRGRIGRCRTPSLLVAGARETEFAAARAFAEVHMPGLDVVTLDAGHAVNLQAPAGFDAAVTAFFRSVTGSDG